MPTTVLGTENEWYQAWHILGAQREIDVKFMDSGIIRALYLTAFALRWVLDVSKSKALSPALYSYSIRVLSLGT